MNTTRKQCYGVHRLGSTKIINDPKNGLLMLFACRHGAHREMIAAGLCPSQYAVSPEVR